MYIIAIIIIIIVNQAELEDGILLHPPIQFGRQHTYGTRCPAHFAMIARCRLALSKRHFRQKATSWWNSLPLELFGRLSSFRYNLYKYLVYIV